MNLAGKLGYRIAAIRVRKEETPAPRLGYTAGIRAGLVRQNAASSPASSEKFLHFCGVKPESSIGLPIGQACPWPHHCAPVKREIVLAFHHNSTTPAFYL
jgi:hypothetical protein